MATLRSLLNLKTVNEPIPLDEVEPVEAITRRFKSGAMSYGSISQEAHEALAGHVESPKAGGDHPFRLISCHARWSIHSVWRDTPVLLRLQRGEPVVYLNPADAVRDS